MNLTTPSDLSPTEAYLWQNINQWHTPPTQPPPDLDWKNMVDMAVANKLTMFLQKIVSQLGIALPADSQQKLALAVAKSQEKAVAYGKHFPQYLTLAHQRHIKTMPLKGLWLSQKLYGDPALRPGHDLDLLVSQPDILPCVALVEQMGFGRYWHTQLADVYYFRHHLHLEMCLEDRWTWIEVHWAYDHPRTLLTIDYDGVLARTRLAHFQGVPLYEPAPEDLIIYLCLHLVKHATYLPYVLDRPDLPRLILADGRLLHFLDIVEAIKQFEGEINWDELATLAMSFGAGEMVAAVFCICQKWFDAPVPASVLAKMPAQSSSPLKKWLMPKMADHVMATYLAQPTHFWWRFLVEENYLLVFRPIRLLDFFAYLMPDQDYLQRRYGRVGIMPAFYHLVKATAEYIQLGVETIYYILKRKWRPPAVFTPTSKE